MSLWPFFRSTSVSAILLSRLRGQLRLQDSDMLSVRVAAALARALPRRAGLVSTSNFFMLSFVFTSSRKTSHLSPFNAMAVRCLCTGGHRALQHSVQVSRWRAAATTTLLTDSEVHHWWKLDGEMNVWSLYWACETLSVSMTRLKYSSEGQVELRSDASFHC